MLVLEELVLLIDVDEDVVVDVLVVVETGRHVGTSPPTIVGTHTSSLSMTFTIAGRDYTLARPGDRLLLPGETVHAARAGDAGASYLIGSQARPAQSRRRS